MRNVCRTPWMLAVSTIAIILTMPSCASRPVTVGLDRSCSVFELQTYDRQLDTPATIRQIGRHNARYRKWCKQEQPK